jgi:hypothetical protein
MTAPTPVFGILLARSSIEVTLLNAQRRVASMKDKLATRDRPLVSRIGNPVNTVSLVDDVDPTVTVSVNFAKPDPTPRIRFGNRVPLKSSNNPISHF